MALFLLPPTDKKASLEFRITYKHRPSWRFVAKIGSAQIRHAREWVMGGTNEQNEPLVEVPSVQFVAHGHDKSESVNLSSTMLVLVKNPDGASSKLDVGRLQKYLHSRPGFLSSPVLREEESLTVIDVEVVDQHTLECIGAYGYVLLIDLSENPCDPIAELKLGSSINKRRYPLKHWLSQYEGHGDLATVVHIVSDYFAHWDDQDYANFSLDISDEGGFEMINWVFSRAGLLFPGHADFDLSLCYDAVYKSALMFNDFESLLNGSVDTIYHRVKHCLDGPRASSPTTSLACHSIMAIQSIPIHRPSSNSRISSQNIRSQVELKSTSIDYLDQRLRKSREQGFLERIDVIELESFFLNIVNNGIVVLNQCSKAEILTKELFCVALAMMQFNVDYGDTTCELSKDQVTELWTDYNTRELSGYKVPFTSHVFNKISNGAPRSPRWFISAFIRTVYGEVRRSFRAGRSPPQNSAEWALRYMDYLRHQPVVDLDFDEPTPLETMAAWLTNFKEKQSWNDEKFLQKHNIGLYRIGYLCAFERDFISGLKKAVNLHPMYRNPHKFSGAQISTKLYFCKDEDEKVAHENVLKAYRKISEELSGLARPFDFDRGYNQNMIHFPTDCWQKTAYDFFHDAYLEAGQE